MKRPSIGQRAILSAQEALANFEVPANCVSESPGLSHLQKVELSVSKILDQMTEVQSALSLFQDGNRWRRALVNREIATTSLFAIQLQKTLVTSAIQSLCRLWDKLNSYKKASFPDLLNLLIQGDTLDLLLQRYHETHSDPEDLPGWYEDFRAEATTTRNELEQRIRSLSNWYATSNLIYVRDKWISHNDRDFDPTRLEHAMQELPLFFERTVTCFDAVNALVKGAGFSWESANKQIERDAGKFLA
jgi:hypothetical protein